MKMILEFNERDGSPVNMKMKVKVILVAIGCLCSRETLAQEASASHATPTFRGVERTEVDTILIPTTWREPGIGLHGEPVEGVRYQIYLLDGLNAKGFAGSTGIREGRLEAVNAAMNSYAVVGRVEGS